MTVMRVIAVDPQPRPGESDLLIFQVPEKSRAHELLIELLQKSNVEFVEIETPSMPEEERKRRKKESARKSRERRRLLNAVQPEYIK